MAIFQSRHSLHSSLAGSATFRVIFQQYVIWSPFVEQLQPQNVPIFYRPQQQSIPIFYQPPPQSIPFINQPQPAIIYENVHPGNFQPPPPKPSRNSGSRTNLPTLLAILFLMGRIIFRASYRRRYIELIQMFCIMKYRGLIFFLQSTGSI